jgi:hypothetical protein
MLRNIIMHNLIIIRLQLVTFLFAFSFTFSPTQSHRIPPSRIPPRLLSHHMRYRNAWHSLLITIPIHLHLPPPRIPSRQFVSGFCARSSLGHRTQSRILQSLLLDLSSSCCRTQTHRLRMSRRRLDRVGIAEPVVYFFYYFFLIGVVSRNLLCTKCFSSTLKKTHVMFLYKLLIGCLSNLIHGSKFKLFDS